MTKDIDQTKRKGRRGSLRLGAFLLGTPILLILGCLGYFYWKISQGPIDMPSVAKHITQDLNDRFEGDYKVKIKQAQLEKLEDSGFAIIATDITVSDSADQIVMEAPRARIGLEIWSLFSTSRSIGLTLESPEINVAYTSEKGLIVADGESLSKLGYNQASTEDIKDYGWIRTSAVSIKETMIWLRNFTDRSQLTHAGFLDAKVNFYIPGIKEPRIFEHTTFFIFRDEAKNDRMTMRLTSTGQMGEWRMESYIEEDQETDEKDFKLVVKDFELAALYPSLSDKDSVFNLTSPMDLDFAFKLNHEDELIDSSAIVTLGAGLVRLYGRKMLLDEADLHFKWYPDDLAITLEPSVVLSGFSSARLTGYAAFPIKAESDRAIELHLEAEDLVVDDDGSSSKEGLFERVSFEGWYAPVSGKLGVNDLFVKKDDERGQILASNGELIFSSQGLGFNYDMQLSNLTTREMLNLWPGFMAPRARNWLEGHVYAGQISQGQIYTRFEPGTLGGQNEIRPFPENSLEVNLQASDVEMKPHPAMPALKKADLDLQAVDNQLILNMSKAVSEVNSGAINLTDSTLKLENMRAIPMRGKFDLNLDSSTSAIMDLASIPLLSMANTDQIPFKASDLKGNSTVKVDLETDLGRDLKERNIQYRVDASFKDFASTSKINGRKFSKGNIKLLAQNGQINISGKANIDGVPSDIVLKADTGKELELIALNTTLTDKQLKEQGYDVSAYMKGKVKVLAGDDGKKFVIDLTDAEIWLDSLGWRKNTGQKGTLTFDMVKGKNGTTLKNFFFQAQDARIAGSVQLDKSGEVRTLSFNKFNLQSSDNVSLNLDFLPQHMELELQGKQFDARGFINALNQDRKESDIKNDMSLKAKINVDRLIGHGRSDLLNTKMFIEMEKGKIKQINGSSFMGTGQLLAQTRHAGNSRKFDFLIKDMGRLARFFNYYHKVSSGDARLVLTSNSQSQLSNAWVALQNVRVDGEPALARFSKTILSDKRYKGQGKLPMKGSFIIRDAEFYADITPDAFKNIKGGLSGPNVGGTVRGSIDRKKKLYNLSGTYIPACTLNNMLNRVPVLGRLLGGREQEGILGVTFAIKGPLNKPRLIVRPASILAPGALRHFFEFRTKKKK